MTISKNRTAILLLAAYFLLWFVPRYDAVIGNTLHMDDFWLYQQNLSRQVETRAHVGREYANGTCIFPPKDGRWGLVASLCISAALDPMWSVSAFPKFLAGAFISVFALMLCLILRLWNVPVAAAALLPTILVTHPIVNEITLWNTTVTCPLVLGLIGGSYLLVARDQSRGRMSVAIFLLMIAVLTYEIYISVFLLFVVGGFVSQIARGISVDVRSTLRLFFVFIFVCLCYLIIAVATKQAGAAGRGLADITTFSVFLSEKYHGLFNLVVNAYAPVISYFVDPLRALSTWKWIPAFVATVTFAAATLRGLPIFWSASLSLYALLVPFLPALPVIAASQSPEAWRVSVPAVVAAILSLIPAINLVSLLDIESRWRGKRNLGPSVAFCFSAAAGAIAIFAGIVAASEARLRVLENSADLQIIRAIENYWQAKGISPKDVRVGLISRQYYHRQGRFNDAELLTTAYHARGPNSAFLHYFSWRGYVFLHGFGVVEIDSDEMTPKLCASSRDGCQTTRAPEFAAKCRSSPYAIHALAGMRIVNDDVNRLSVVCI